MTEFHEAIHTKATKDQYNRRLLLFFDQIEIHGSNLPGRTKTFVSKAKSDTVWATRVINEYLHYQKERAERKEISEATVSQYWKPIKLLLEQNDIVLNWGKISRRIPKGRNFGNDRAPTVDEVERILAYPDRRIKAAVLVELSSGIRVGAWDFLNWGHFEPVVLDGAVVAAKMKVYAGTPDEYPDFCSGESYSELKKYIDFRVKSGEDITPSSPALRDIWEGDVRGKHGHVLEKPKRLASSGVKRLVEDAIKAANLRKPLEKGKHRHEFQALHGFRKFFKSAAERRMKTLHVEMLMGHRTGLSNNYYRPTEQELLDDYIRALPDLTIGQEFRSRLKSEVVEKERGKEFESLRRELREEKERRETLEQRQRDLFAEYESKLEAMLKRATGLTRVAQSMAADRRKSKTTRSRR